MNRRPIGLALAPAARFSHFGNKASGSLSRHWISVTFCDFILKKSSRSHRSHEIMGMCILIHGSAFLLEVSMSHSQISNRVETRLCKQWDARLLKSDGFRRATRFERQQAYFNDCLHTPALGISSGLKTEGTMMATKRSSSHSCKLS